MNFKLLVFLCTLSVANISQAEQPIIHQLIEGGRVNELNVFIAQNKSFDVEEKDEYGNTPLMSSAYPCHGSKCNDYNDYAEMAEILIKNHANINYQDKYGRTALSKAADSGNYYLVKTLLKYSANPNESSISPLINAASHCNDKNDCNNYTAIFDLLLKNNADLNFINKEGHNVLHEVLHEAVIAGNYLIIQKLEKTPSIKNQLRDKASELLNIASGECYDEYQCNNNFLIAELIVKYLKNINHIDKNETLLYNAALGGNIKVTNLLLKLGADPNIKNTNGDTPLRVASKLDSIGIAKSLIQHGAKISNTGNSVTNIWSAACENNINMVKLLIKSGADINEKNIDDGETALDCAKYNHDQDMIKLLTKNGAR